MSYQNAVMDSCQVNAQMGREWSSLSAQAKQPYTTRAAELKHAATLLHPISTPATSKRPEKPKRARKSSACNDQVPHECTKKPRVPRLNGKRGNKHFAEPLAANETCIDTPLPASRLLYGWVDSAISSAGDKMTSLEGELPCVDYMLEHEGHGGFSDTMYDDAMGNGVYGAMSCDDGISDWAWEEALHVGNVDVHHDDDDMHANIFARDFNFDVL